MTIALESARRDESLTGAFDAPVTGLALRALGGNVVDECGVVR